MQGAGGHVEGAGVQQEGAASSRVAANGVTHVTSGMLRVTMGGEKVRNAQLSKSRKAEVETNSYAHLFVKVKGAGCEDCTVCERCFLAHHSTLK